MERCTPSAPPLEEKHPPFSESASHHGITVVADSFIPFSLHHKETSNNSYFRIIDVSGKNGADGVNGEVGAQGIKGAHGANGQDGSGAFFRSRDGSNGKRGKSGSHGGNGTSGSHGKNGQNGIRGTIVIKRLLMNPQIVSIVQLPERSNEQPITLAEIHLDTLFASAHPLFVGNFFDS